MNHRFVWDSFADVGEGSFAAVRVRVAALGHEGPAAETADFLLANGPAAAGIELVRGPTSRTSRATARSSFWRTAASTAGVVLWGETPDLGHVARGSGPGVPEPATERAVRLDGLEPGRTCFYRVADGNRPLSPLETLAAGGAALELPEDLLLLLGGDPHPSSRTTSGARTPPTSRRSSSRSCRPRCATRSARRAS